MTEDASAEPVDDRRAAGPTEGRGRDGAQVRRVARRCVPWLIAALAFWLLSLTAVFDLRSLLVGLAAICVGLGVIVAVFTWFDRGDRG